MMKIKVKLYGTLGNHLPNLDPLEALLLEIPEGSTVDDLIDRLAVPREKVGIVSVDGRLVKATEPLHSNNFVRIYRPLAGG